MRLENTATAICRASLVQSDKSRRTRDRGAIRRADARFDLNAAFAFEAVQIAADAIRRANSNEPAAIHAALKTTDIKDHIVYGGPIRFDEKGQIPTLVLSCCKIKTAGRWS